MSKKKVRKGDKMDLLYKQYYQKYGYRPKQQNYICGNCEFETFLEKAVNEGKELNEYLKEVHKV